MQGAATEASALASGTRSGALLGGGLGFTREQERQVWNQL